MMTFSLCLLSLLIVEGHGTLPVRISSNTIAKEGENACPSQVNIESQLNVTKEEIRNRISDTVNPFLDSSRPCGGSGWTRVAYMNMTDPGSVCPTNWTLHNSPVRSCGQTQTSGSICDSAFFSVSGQSYSRVCGRILAYQAGTTDAFRSSVSAGRTSIDSAYVEGVSVTHGPAGSRQHIWTFASALHDNDPSYNPALNCPCTNTRYNWPYQLPSFIQNKYFCDTGNTGPSVSGGYTFYTADPLWDGAGCGADSTCCQFNNPPWFYSSLPQATTDDVEVRLCIDVGPNVGNVIIYLLEIYAGM